MAMTIGVQIHNNDTTWADLVAVSQTLDAGPWDSIWTHDHFVPPLAFMDEMGAEFEGWTLLAGLATVTQRAKLGVIVSGNTYRNPALLAKMAITLDHMSGGRCILGIGAGWHEREHEAFGWDFPSLKERSDRLEEACALIHALFKADGPVNFEGHYYRLVRAPFQPKSLQAPHLPIMVGGGGEKRTLRTLARYGDIMNVSGSPETVRRKIAVLEEHCAAVGRDPAEIQKTAFVVCALTENPQQADRMRGLFGGQMSEEERKRDLPIGSADQIIEVLKRYEAAGCDGVIFQSIPNRPYLYERLAEQVLPAVI